MAEIWLISWYVQFIQWFVSFARVYHQVMISTYCVIRLFLFFNWLCRFCFKFWVMNLKCNIKWFGVVQDGPLLVANGVRTPFRCPYKWITGVITLRSGVIHGRGLQRCSHFLTFGFCSLHTLRNKELVSYGSRWEVPSARWSVSFFTSIEKDPKQFRYVLFFPFFDQQSIGCEGNLFSPWLKKSLKAFIAL